MEYHGFVRVHMHVQRPIHVSTAITRTSWYRLMRPVKERTLNDVDGYEVRVEVWPLRVWSWGVVIFRGLRSLILD